MVTSGNSNYNVHLTLPEDPGMPGPRSPMYLQF